MSERKEEAGSNVVDRIFRLAAEGWSPSQIAEMLNEDAMRSDRGRVWCTDQLNRLFGVRRDEG